MLLKGLKGKDGLYNGFCRMDCAWGRQEVYDTTEGWTGRRSSDGMFVQINFILSDANALVEANWNDFIIPIGIDHRCVHCRLAFRTRTQKQLQQHGMQHGTPHMDGQDGPTILHHVVTKSMAGRTRRTSNDFEAMLMPAG